MDKGSKQIELRSEKVRNIIGQVPPILLRYGITIIGFSLLILVGVSILIPYQPSFETEITVTQDTSGMLHFSATISQKAMKRKSQFNCITATSSSELPLPSCFQIATISDTAQLSDNNVWYTALLYPMDSFSKNVKLNDDIIISGEIMLAKRSLLMWVVDKVKDEL